MTREQVATYTTGDQVAPPQPHRSRIVLPLPEGDAELDSLIVHELTHLLVSEIILPGRGEETAACLGGCRKALRTYMVGFWSDEDERLMRELVASGERPGPVTTDRRGRIRRTPV